jgi:hypothetical protein
MVSLTSTLLILFTSFSIIALVLGVGLLSTRTWFETKNQKMAAAIWIGWLWLATYVSVLHLFFAMRWWLVLPLFVLSAVGWIFFLKSHHQKRPVSTPRYSRMRVLTLFALIGLASCLLILLSNQSLRSPGAAPDTGGYHVPYAMLAQQFPVIPGVGHLNPYLGYAGQILDLWSALTNSILSITDSYRFIQLTFVTSLVITLLLLIIPEFQKRPYYQLSPQVIFLCLTLVGVLLVTPSASIWISALKADLPALILALVGIAFALPSSATTSLNNYLVSFASLVTATCLRPGTAFLIFIPLLFLFGSSKKPILKLWRWLQKNKFSAIFLGIGVTLLPISMLVGNTIRTGFPLFPFSTLRFVTYDWSLPVSQAQAYIDYVRSFSVSWLTTSSAEIPYLTRTDALLGVLRDPSVQITVASLLTASVVLILGHKRVFTRVRNHKLILLLAVSFIATAAPLTLLVMRYPQPRYVWPYLLALGFIPLSCILGSSESGGIALNRKSKLIGGISLSALLTIIFLQTGFLGSALLNPVQNRGGGFLGSIEPIIGKQRTYVSKNGVVTVTTSDGTCWDTPPPCTFYLPPGPAYNLAFRGNGLSDGFKLTK